MSDRTEVPDGCSPHPAASTTSVTKFALDLMREHGPARRSRGLSSHRGTHDGPGSKRARSISTSYRGLADFQDFQDFRIAPSWSLWALIGFEQGTRMGQFTRCRFSRRDYARQLLALSGVSFTRYFFMRSP